MEIIFSKYHGAGNDFIFIDNRDARYTLSKGQRQKMCQQHFGIGADGLIEIRSSAVADFKMLYFNSDGFEGKLCGNGSRCSIAFAFKIGIRKRNAGLNETEVANCGFERINIPDNELNQIRRNSEADIGENKTGDEFNDGKFLERVGMSLERELFTFEAADGIHVGGVSGEIATNFGNHGNMFYVDLKDVTFDKIKVYDDGDIFIDVGAPHHVRFLSCGMESFDVAKQGRELSRKLYGSEGSNVNFVFGSGGALSCDENLARKFEDETKGKTSDQNVGQDKPEEDTNGKSTDKNVGKNVMFVRTYERGVNDETFACGTGSVAASIADYVRRMAESEVQHVNKKDSYVKGDVTSSDVTLASKFRHQDGDSSKTNKCKSEEDNSKIHKEKRISKMRGGCLIVTFTVNKKEDAVSGRVITFSDIILAGPVEHVFDGVYKI